MTPNPELHDPIADIGARLNASLPGEFHRIISKYAGGLPVAAAYAVPTTQGGRADRIHWVSGASLVTLDYKLETVGGAQAATARGRVRSLTSARVEIEAVIKSSGQLRAVERTVRLYFPDASEPVQFPDPLSPPLDEVAALEKYDTFLDALLRALDPA